MRVAISQPNYLPWRGYFDLIDDVDLFVYLDDVQYTRRDWRNRNRIKTPQGTAWLTVPVLHADRGEEIREVIVDRRQPWVRKHLAAFRAAYARAPYTRDHLDSLAGILARDFDLLWQLDVALTEWVKERLAIATPCRLASEFGVRGKGSAGILELLRRVGATTYLSGPSAGGYLDVAAFESAGIALEFKSYDYAKYPQLWGAFEPSVTVLDLLFNCGPASRGHLKSRTPNRRVC